MVNYIEQHQSGLKQFFKAVLTNMAIGGAVALLLLTLRPYPFYRYLQHAGSDYVMTLCASTASCVRNWGKKVAVVDLAPGTDSVPAEPARKSFGTVAELDRVLPLLTSVDPAAVLLDIDLDIAAEQSRANIRTLARELRNILDRKQVRIPLVLLEHATPEHPDDARAQNNFALSQRWFDQDLFGSLPDSPYLFRAIPALPVDPDGVVRSMLAAVCALPPDAAWGRVRTLAYALERTRENQNLQCPSRSSLTSMMGDHYIVFQAGPDVMSAIDPDPPILFRRSGDIYDPRSVENLRNKYVLIGQISWSDTHATPLGSMPGVLVQANALATALNHPEGVPDMELLSIPVIEITLFSIVGALSVLIDAFIVSVLEFSLHLHRPALHRPAWKYKVHWCPINHDDYHITNWPSRFVNLTSQLTVSALLFLLFYLVWNAIFMQYAEHGLVGGIVVGTFVPVLGTLLEVLIDTGASIHQFVHASVEAVCSRLGRIKTLLILAVLIKAFSPGTAAATPAEDCWRNPGPMLEVTSGAFPNVFVLRAASSETLHPTSQDPFPLQPFDTVQLRDANATVEICIPDLPPVVLEQAHTHYLVPPPAPAKSAGVWHDFFAALMPQPAQATTRFGATVITRGLRHHGHQAGIAADSKSVAQIKDAKPGANIFVPLSGPLRPIAALAADEQFVVAAHCGLALAWLGGQPPYTVTIAADGASQALHLDKPLLWLPNWHMSGSDASIVVQDAHGGSIRLHLTAASRPDLAEASPGQAVELFQSGGPSWRLEAFRDLQSKAGSNTLASQAVAAIRLAGAAQ